MSRLEPHRYQTATGNKGTSKRYVVGGTVAEAEMSPKVSGGLELETQTWDSDGDLGLSERQVYGKTVAEAEMSTKVSGCLD